MKAKYLAFLRSLRQSIRIKIKRLSDQQFALNDTKQQTLQYNALELSKSFQEMLLAIVDAMIGESK